MSAAPASSRTASSSRRPRSARSRAAPTDRRSSLSASVGGDQQQPDQQQGIRPVPELRPEAPDPAEQQTTIRIASSSQPADAGEVRPRVEQAERVELLGGEGTDRIAARHEDLALAERERTGVDRWSAACWRACGGRASC